MKYRLRSLMIAVMLVCVPFVITGAGCRARSGTRAKSPSPVAALGLNKDDDRNSAVLKRYIPVGTPIADAVTFLERSGFRIDHPDGDESGKYKIRAEIKQPEGYLERTWLVGITCEDGRVTKIACTSFAVGP